MQWWTEEGNQILAGKDLQAGGTWLGITKQGKFAAITNYRDFRNLKTDSPSRGPIIIDFLKSNSDTLSFLHELDKKAGLYNGFNLLIGNITDQLFYYSSVNSEIKEVKAGIHGISNAFMDTPWPKLLKAKQLFSQTLTGTPPDIEKMMMILADKETFAGELLPDTGIGLEMEKFLSSIYIRNDKYGTRSSTVICVKNSYEVNIYELKRDLGQLNSFIFKLQF
jgi:uncharacterized protein with NRDE domain